MKRTILILTVVILSCCSNLMAQQARVAFFSYKTVLNSLPQYVKAHEELDKLRQQYAEELKASEQEFTDKYEMFLEQQSTMAASIKEKRQSDLQNLYDRTIKFRNDSETLLKQKEQEGLAPLKEKILEAAKSVGSKGGYLLVVNTDGEECPYISPDNSTDVTEEIIKLAKAMK